MTHPKNFNHTILRQGEALVNPVYILQKRRLHWASLPPWIFMVDNDSLRISVPAIPPWISVAVKQLILNCVDVSGYVTNELKLLELLCNSDNCGGDRAHGYEEWVNQSAWSSEEEASRWVSEHEWHFQEGWRVQPLSLLGFITEDTA